MVRGEIAPRVVQLQPRRDTAWCEVKLRLAWCNYSPAGTLRGAKCRCASRGATTAPQGHCVVRSEIAPRVVQQKPRRDTAWCEVKLRLAWCNYSPAGTLRGANWNCAVRGAAIAPQGHCVVRGEIALSVVQLQPRRDTAWCEVSLRLAWCDYSPAGTLRGAKWNGPRAPQLQPRSDTP